MERIEDYKDKLVSLTPTISRSIDTILSSGMVIPSNEEIELSEASEIFSRICEEELYVSLRRIPRGLQIDSSTYRIKAYRGGEREEICSLIMKHVYPKEESWSYMEEIRRSGEYGKYWIRFLKGITNTRIP